jgi:hypothetical protein
MTLHNADLTTDTLLKRNWPCNSHCSLCDQEAETIEHITINYSFAKQVWQHVNDWAQMMILSSVDAGKELKEWWNENRGIMGGKKQAEGSYCDDLHALGSMEREK